MHHYWLLYGHLTATKKFASHKETLGSLGNNGKKEKQCFIWTNQKLNNAIVELGNFCALQALPATGKTKSSKRKTRPLLITISADKQNQCYYLWFCLQTKITEEL